jgi:hypothetical protein
MISDDRQRLLAHGCRAIEQMQGLMEEIARMRAAKKQ